MNQQISVVVPAFNEENNLPELRKRLLEVLESLSVSFEIIFINDGSTDHTDELLCEMATEDTRIKRIRLSRNFGHQAALSAGLDAACGDSVVFMDADLQDTPEAIRDFWAARQEGAEVIYAVRASRRESWPRRLAFKLFYRLMSNASRIRQPLDAGIFCMMDRRVADVIRSMPERGRYFPGLRAYAGYRQQGVPVDRDIRFSDEPKVGTLGQVRLAMDAILSFSTAPIRMFTGLGLFIAVGSFIFLMTVVIRKLLYPEHVALGIASILVAVLFLGGLQLIMLGIIGEYIGRIYEESKQRPYYIVSDKQNFDSES